MGMLLQVAALCSFLLKNVNTDPSFATRFCAYPPNFGAGVYDASSTSCAIVHDIVTKTASEARRFCMNNGPYTLSKSQHGEKTKCTYIALYKCDISEVLIGNRCFRASRKGKLQDAPKLCPKGLKFHTIRSRLEQKWITIFFANYRVLWVGNTLNETSNLNIIEKGKKLTGSENLLVNGHSNSLVQLVDYFRFLPSGHLAYADPANTYAALCSREAGQFQSYVNHISVMVGKIGYNVHNYKDRNGNLRAFVIMRLPQKPRAVKFKLDVTHFDDVCQVFPHGYAASPLDFKDQKDFREMLKKENVNVVLIPARRRPNDTSVNPNTCKKDRHYLSNRIVYEIVLQNGTDIIDQDMWRKTFPDRTCSILPRIALGYTQQGIVDIPPFVQHFIVCGFGTPPTASGRRPEEQCHKLATYDPVKKECHCNKEEDDIRNIDQDDITAQERSVPPGIVCLSCTLNAKHDIVVAADASGSIGDEDFQIEKDFMASLAPIAAKYNLGVGLIGFSDDNYFVRDIQRYPNEQDLKRVINGITYPAGLTQIAGALQGMVTMFKASGTPGSKRLGILITDGIANDSNDIPAAKVQACGTLFLHHDLHSQSTQRRNLLIKQKAAYDTGEELFLRTCEKRGDGGVGPCQHEFGDEHRCLRTTYNPTRTFTVEKMWMKTSFDNLCRLNLNIML